MHRRLTRRVARRARPRRSSVEPLRLFICYARADENDVRKFIPNLKVLSKRGYIAPWQDTDLVPGDDWDDMIKERLCVAQVILFMVSTDFLASKYISDDERPLAMRRRTEGKAVVIPVLLSACTWEQEDFATIENLPSKGRLLTSYTPRANGWKRVEEGIRAAVVSARPLLMQHSDHIPINRHSLSKQLASVVA